MEIKSFLFLLQVTSFIQDIDFGDTKSSDEDAQPKKRSRNTWKPDMIAQLAEICRNTDLNDLNHYRIVKNEWYNLNPNSNITEKALQHKYHQITQLIRGKSKRPLREVKWDQETSDDLLDAYLNTYPYDKSSPVELSVEWERRHPDFPRANNSFLSHRARSWIEKRKLNFEEESSKRLFEWTPRQDSDIVHVYNITLPERKRRPMVMHRIFTDLHPDLRELTTDQMAERIDYLRGNPPDEHFPWTEEQNMELLKLYHSTSPEVPNQGQRIYDIWTKIHPRYKFMTPYYLQVHASNFAQHALTGQGKRTALFTNTQEANLVDMYRRLGKPNRSLYDVHKAWVREYPSLAFISPDVLVRRARRIASRNNPAHKSVIEGGQQCGSSSSVPRRYRHYTPDEKAVLMAIFKQTDPHIRGHSKRIYEKWSEKNDVPDDIEPKSLKQTIRRWIREDSRRKGKEPMVTPKTEVESESSPSTDTM